MQIPGRVVMFFEYGNYLRQIFTDGRKHQNLTPLWMGDSIAHWEGDTLVVDANGFNDKTWIDNEGHPHSDQLHVVERIHRQDRDHLLDVITVDDPKTYTKSLTSKRIFKLQPEWNIAEFVCEDNNAFLDYEKKAEPNRSRERKAICRSRQAMPGHLCLKSGEPAALLPATRPIADVAPGFSLARLITPTFSSSRSALYHDNYHLQCPSRLR